jgi:hypothetical protein
VEKKRQPMLNSLASKAPSCFLIAWIYEAFPDRGALPRSGESASPMLQICNGADQFETVSSVLTRSWAVYCRCVRAVGGEAFAVRALFALRQIVAESA